MTDRPDPRSAPDPDPRGLIREAFAIAKITEPDCRSIFFDWALGLDPAQDPSAAIQALLQRHADQPKDHPMRKVLLEGLERESAAPAQGRRRGGRRARVERA